MAYISEQLRREVAERANHRCEYCHSTELVIGRTRTGRSTVIALQMNHPTIVRARSLWVSCGIHPSKMDQRAD